MNDYDPAMRYRVYRAASAHMPQDEIAGCATKDAIGTMLVQLHADGEFNTNYGIGLLDTAGWARGETGTWIINPYLGR